MHVSHPIILTQSYDSLTNKFSESFSVGLVNVPVNRILTIRNLLVQGFYFRTSRALDTPVSLAICPVSQPIGPEILARHASGITVQADPETGSLTTYTGTNPQIGDIGAGAIKKYMPHRFGFFDVAAAQYANASAQGVLNSPNKDVRCCFLIQGASYSGNFLIDASSQNGYLALIPYIAGLKQAEIACSARISFDIEVQ